jgi:2-polyprenyl-6-methoxyphenol hydroxylase-like FAD-dependent oxidoreductase
MDELTQIRMRSWRRGRVTILGDAAWCVTPMGGGGASLALTAGYILAANLHKLGDGIHDRGRLDAALQDIDDWLRPLVDNVQKIPKAMISFAYPQTRVGLASRRLADRILLSKPLKPIAAKFTHIADTDQPLPELDI